MPKDRPTSIEIVTGFVSVAVIFLIILASALILVNDPLLSQMIDFAMAAQYIAAVYPLPYSENNALADAEDALFNLLDPFSFRIERRDYKTMIEEMSGHYSGIGISVIPRDTVLLVITVREGGPAYTAGMKNGDLILEVDGEAIRDMDPDESIDAIRGPSGSTVDLLLYRFTVADTLSVTVARQSITLEHIPYYGLTPDSVAYIRIADFESGTAEELEVGVKQLELQKPRGYVIDLRGNPGGYLDEAIDAADLFMKKRDLIVGIDSRSRWDNMRYRSKSRPLTDRPVVMITDQGSASAAEIFSGALRGADRGVIVGDTTFGKGLVQTVFSLVDGDALRLTTSRYYFADGRYLNPPDSELAFSGLAPDMTFIPKGEIGFEERIQSSFLLYDFVETYWDMLTAYPPEFAYPDTVISLFEAFVTEQGMEYTSGATRTIDFALAGQIIDNANAGMLDVLTGMLAKSRQLDDSVFIRQSDRLEFFIRRIAVERELGRAAAYRYVIVPGEPEIRLATDIVLDSSIYNKLLQGADTTAEVTGPQS